MKIGKINHSPLKKCIFAFMILWAMGDKKRYGIISFFVLFWGAALHGQEVQDATSEDSVHVAANSGDGINYTPTYYYSVNSLIPTTSKRFFADTSIFNSYNQDASLRSRNLYANLGIFGQAQFSMNFSFERMHGFTYKTMPYKSYLRTIDHWKMYEPDKTYTHLEWNFISGNEHHFSVAHAQKITDDLSFGLALESILAEGRYLRQRVRDINLGLTFQYLMPSHRYGFEAYYICNFLSLNENGGVADDSFFEKDSSNNPRTISIRLGNASSSTFQNIFLFRQFLALSGKDTTGIVKNRIGFLVHDFQVNTSKNHFFDTHLGAGNDAVFYLRRDTTSDLTKNYLLRNSFMWTNYKPGDTMPNKANYLHIAAGILYDFIQVKDTGVFPNFIANGDTLIRVNRHFIPFVNNQFTPFGRIYLNLFNHLHIEASLFFTLNGYNAGDLTLNGKAGLDLSNKGDHKHELALNLGLYNYSPDYFFTHLVANSYLWENKLNKQQTLLIGAEWNHKQYQIGLNYYTLHNYTLLDTNSLPVQLNGFANVYQFTAYIPFHYKGFGFNTHIYLQYTDNKSIRIPTFVGRQSVYYGFFLFKKALYLQAGADFLYNTAYYANSYNPVLQQFYMQNTKEIGNYGYLDFYLRAKVNRFVISAKLTHVWAGLFGKNYYLVPHYPAQDFGFTAGISWRFYD